MSVITRFEVSLNGKRVQTDAANLHALLVAHNFDLKAACACAINSRFVARSDWAARTLKNGDCIDVVAPITGG